MNLSKNFSLYELTNSATAREQSIDNTPSKIELDNLKKLCETILQPIRDKYGKPITITSGYRCPKLNRAVGGSSSSQHVKGEAADIICEDNKELFNIILNMIENNEIVVGQLIDEYDYKWIHISLPYHKKNNILHL